MMKTKFIRLLIALLVLTLFSCGPTVNVLPSYNINQPQKLLLLDTEFETTLPQERKDLVHELFKSGLKNKGYLVFDGYGSRQCQTWPCASLGAPDAAIRLTVDSVARANVLLAYYNSVSGIVKVFDRNNEAFLEVKHSASERGGLIFESGQVVQAIVSQYNSSSNDSFVRLVSKFLEETLDAFPEIKRKEESTLRAQSLSISDVSSTMTSSRKREICITGSPQKKAFLKVGSTRTTMREIEAGRYCSILREKVLKNKKIKAELQDFYGDSVSRVVQI